MIRNALRPFAILRYSIALGMVMMAALHTIAQNPAEEISFREGLAIGRVSQSGRSAIHQDPIEFALVLGEWEPPIEGQSLLIPPDQESKWTRVKAGEDGWFGDRALRGGYLYFSLQSNEETIMLLDASGHNMVYVNGLPRTGDRYSSGITLLPVQLKAGNNEFLFQSSRGRVKAKLVPPPSPALLSTRDNTLPDLIVGKETHSWGALVAINASQEPLKNAALWVTGKGLRSTLTPIPDLLPLGIRKVAFQIQSDAPLEEGTIEAQIQLVRQETDAIIPLDKTTLTLRIRRADQSRKCTFISDIDGSIQYYAVQPAQPISYEFSPPALFLSLHGASVEALGQADAYANKTWGHIVAPTNRRPYGFDWEDWGRMDAMEVFNLAKKQLRTDPQRSYLTGHSMGGHGTWQIGALFPDQFAAIAPSAGWISFWSYADAAAADEQNPIEAMMKRSVAASDTLRLATNYLHQGIYILHGDADDNVPVSEARTMKEYLKTFHRDFDGHEQAGAGHWWDASDEPGADCVDWAPLFDFFARHRIPRDSELRTVDFTTANPGISARSHWLTILAQTHPLQPSNAKIRFDPGKSRFVGTTQNISRLALEYANLPTGSTIALELDGETLCSGELSIQQPVIYLDRTENHWAIGEKPSASHKGPHRYGPFKQAFCHRMVFVYGTQGSHEENIWALAKARYDAEEFWYRGNGAIHVVPDVEFDPQSNLDQNVILYGNADTNRVWNALLADSPVQVCNQSISVGNSTFTANDLCCLFVRPRPGSDTACIAAVSGTGLMGMRLTDRLPYFVSGVGYPDCTVMGPEILTQGSEGIRAAGFFGLDWSVETGEFAGIR